MNIRYKNLVRRGLLSCLLAAFLTPAWAQEDAMKDYPGYVDFGQLDSIFGEPAVQISVGESLLNLVGAFGAIADEEVGNLFNRLYGVRVKVFVNGGITDSAIDHVKEVSAALKRDGWEAVVSVDHAHDQVRVFMKFNDDTVEGITLMALEHDEAVFINVIGDLNPDELRHVMDNFNIDLDDHHHDHDDDDDV